ncbi:MAG: ATP-dependent DNA helicase PcrA [Candidatus Magasanikbacteria bacterium GW2011_GWA2_46_17]|uniref:DNA 3'-5' helicase n=1 Tax=Candidatus Magasanikbacteria bacterium GW2011_GWA2_46_17 TaxID=1619042 RepID=A0A0G1R923_9BACT|nr:MAG: ATP-dependent DNA helicase PcrA [Candidatus Magasanikbacteria bacterium GW2011_GWA2_46_17]
MEHLIGLNEQQKQAVLQKDGPVLIIAGAGAGKTKTITHRILHLIKGGADPRSILAVTFTNKAAKEMRERVHTLLASDKSLNFPTSDFSPVTSYMSHVTCSPFISTFHALGVHILKENARLLNIPRHFTILDKSDSSKLIKDAMDQEEIDRKNFDPALIQNLISREKGDAVTCAEFEAKASTEYIPQIVAKVWTRYEASLVKEKALDFDDLLLKTARLLKENAGVREHYQNIWRHIHIDEYQDTNRVQHLIAKYLAEKHKNICVVGDPDQLIYEWRGAHMKNIMGFEKDYPNAKIIFLEENYRSTQTILTAANRVIAKNKMRKEKNLFTKNGEGERIGLMEAYDENDEARFVAQKCKELIDERAVSASEIAVLYRANFQSRALEEAMLQNEVPYQVLGIRFFERKEVKDIIAYLKAALNPEGLSDLKRIINVPPRGLGKVTVLKVFAGQESTLPAATRKKVADFKNVLVEIKNTAFKEKPSQTIKYILRASGMEEGFRKGGNEEAERLENIKELVTFATKYDIYANPEEGTERFLEDAALASDQDELMKNKSAVKLMTVHAAKGLEFEYVFITGLEDDLFPHKKLNSGGFDERQSEEERRLFYVALTRAKKKLYLSYASVRTIFGSKQVNVPSEFIFDVDDELVEKEERFEGGGKIIYLD